MTQSGRQGVCGILLGRTGQPQQRLDHMLNLFFVSGAGTDHRLFDLPGCILESSHATEHTGGHGCTSSMSQLQRRIGATRHENLLDRQLLGLILIDNLQ